MKSWIAKALLAAAVAAGTSSCWNRQATPSYATAKVEKTDIVETIGATGTVEPEEVVDVGAQIAGQVIAFGKDTAGKSVDYGSVVEAGSMLAQLDDEVYRADLAQAEAQHGQAEAQVASAEANLAVLTAKFNQAKADWERAQKLGPSDALAATTYDNYKAAYETALANLDTGRAAIQQAKAQIAIADAAVARAKRNLGYCVIKTPVRGVVIDRRVNIGQTVNGSMNAASLFLIAKDLRRMQVWVAVNEADIGSLKPGMPATFQVDAFPGREFKGEVGKVRLNATMTQNVVTYTIEVVTDNSDGKLLPYLTANVKFEAARRDGVLAVPNAALRFTPKNSETAAKTAEAGKTQKGQHQKTTEETRGETHKRGTLWVRVRDGEGGLRPVAVRTGLSDGTKTEVEGEGLAEGMEIIVADSPAKATSATAAMPSTGTGATADSNGTTSPFAPKMPNRRGNPVPPPR